MIDHVSVRVQDFGRAVAFYRAALAPVGYRVLMEFPGAAGLGAGGKPDLWLMQSDQPSNPMHIALTGERSVIHAFHAAALEAGGTDNGPPGPRPDYHPHYYAAFIYDPEGNNIEIVSHEDPTAPKLAARKPPARKPAAGKKLAARKSAAKPVAKAKSKPKAKAAAKPKAKPTRGRAAAGKRRKR